MRSDLFHRPGDRRSGTATGWKRSFSRIPSALHQCRDLASREYLIKNGMKLPSDSWPWATSTGTAGPRSLRFTDLSAGTLEIIDWADVPHDVRISGVFTNTHLYVTGQLVGFKGVPLLADLDNDSLQSRAERMR